MRVTRFAQTSDTTATLAADFATIALSFDMQASFHAESERPRLLPLPQWTHCLADLLQRYSSGELKVLVICPITPDKPKSCKPAWRTFEHLDIESAGKSAAGSAFSRS